MIEIKYWIALIMHLLAGICAGGDKVAGTIFFLYLGWICMH